MNVPLTIQQTATAVGANCPASFQAYGGVSPYSYSVVPYSGAGGTITSGGAYTGPSIASSDPRRSYDTIIATDSVGSTASAKILVGTAIELFCDIIQNGMGLSSDQVWLWDQKINIPNDSRLYVAVSVPSVDVTSNSNTPSNSSTNTLNQSQSVNCTALVDVDILSRSPAARDFKEQVVLATNTVYSQQQQAANTFSILRNSTNFINLSGIDGASIPYRYRVTFVLFYLVKLIQPGQYFDTFLPVSTTTNSN